MEEYQEISIWGYQNSDRDPEEEYYRREDIMHQEQFIQG